MDPQEHAPYLLHLLGAERSLEELAGLSPKPYDPGPSRPCDRWPCHGAAAGRTC